MTKPRTASSWNAYSNKLDEINALSRPTRDVVWSTEVIIGTFLHVEAPTTELHHSYRTIRVHVKDVLDGSIKQNSDLEIVEPMFPVSDEVLSMRMSGASFLLFLHPDVGGRVLGSEIANPNPSDLEEIRNLIASRESLPLGDWAAHHFQEIRTSQTACQECPPRSAPSER